MIDKPLRSQASIERADGIFRRLTRSRRGAMSTAHPTSLLGIAMVAAFTSLLIGLQRMTGMISWIPAIPPREALLMTLGILILGAVSASRAPLWSQPSLPHLVYSALPFLAFSLLKQDQRPKPGPISIPETIRGALKSGDRETPFSFRKSFLWRRIEVGIVSLIIQVAAVPILFIFLGCGLARYPSGSPGYFLSYWLQGYAMVASLVACFRYESTATRGKLTSRWPFPLWPLTALPVLNVVAIFMLMNRDTPHGPLVTSLFFDRRIAPRYRWDSLAAKLPRLRRSSLHSTGEVLKVQSFLRVATVLLSLEVGAIGIYWPLPFYSLVADWIAGVGATLCILAGLLLKGIQPPGKAPRPGTTRIVLAWSLLSLGSAFLGLLIGSAVGRAQIQLAGVQFYSFGMLGTVLAGLLMIVASGYLSGASRDGFWILVLWAFAILGGLATRLVQLEDPLEQLLLWSGILAWLLHLPIGLLYQRLFLAPFTLRDLWRRDLPSATRRRLLPATLALLLPLGGLANALLAVTAQRRDERLQLWWQAQQQAEHTLETRGYSAQSSGAAA